MKKKTKRIYLVWTPGEREPWASVTSRERATNRASIWPCRGDVIIPIDIPVSAIPKAKVRA